MIEPVFDFTEKTWYMKQKMDNGQTIYMGFQLSDITRHAHYWNIILCVYTKRRNIGRIFDEKQITGKNPIATVHAARSMFYLLERKVEFLGNRKVDNIIYCTWLDNRRRDAYYRFLHRRGYEYGMLFGQKVIYKVFPSERSTGQKE